jgi:hypothetical protein
LFLKGPDYRAIVGTIKDFTGSWKNTARSAPVVGEWMSRGLSREPMVQHTFLRKKDARLDYRASSWLEWLHRRNTWPSALLLWTRTWNDGSLPAALCGD